VNGIEGNGLFFQEQFGGLPMCLAEPTTQTQNYVIKLAEYQHWIATDQRQCFCGVVRVAYGVEVARLRRVLPEVIEQVEISTQDHAGHSVKDALVGRFFRVMLIKRLGQPAFIGYDAGDGIAIQQPQHQQMPGLVAGDSLDVSDGRKYASMVAHNKI